MKVRIILIAFALLYVNIGMAQIPNQVKERITQLVLDLDKLRGTSEIEKKVKAFVKQAPNEEMKKNVLQLMIEKSNSAKVKAVLQAELEGTKDVKPSEEGNYILLKNATIIDVVSDQGRKGNLLIKDARIETIDFSGAIEVPQGAMSYDLNGKYIIPGLIDAHVHITHGTLKDTQEDLHLALKHGITGVRDMGGDGRILTVLQKNMKIGEEIGADVFFSTIIAGPEFFAGDPRPQQVAKGAIAGEVPWQRAITRNSDLKQIVAEAKGLGVTAIKVYDSVDKDLFRKVAAEAKRQGLKVWSHAVVPPTKAIDITNGGSDVMSHAGDMVEYEFMKGDLKGRHSFTSKEDRNAYRKKLKNVNWDENSPKVKQLFTAMKKNNSILDATLFVYYHKLDSPTITPDSTRYKSAMKSVSIAHEMGVKIGAGSDHMITKGEYGKIIINIHKELELLVEAGLSPLEALRAATIINAEGLGEEKDIGTIEEGKLANLVILNANPLEDITNTQQIKLVIKRGKLIF